MKTFILPCAGDQSRWGNYTGTNKHFVEIDGEPLIHRTIRLIRKYGDNPDIHMLARSDDYRLMDVIFHKIEPDMSYADLGKIIQSQEIWKQYNEVTILYGDVFFTEKAMETICNNQKSPAFFGRLDKSEITGKEYGEIFGLYIQLKDYDLIVEKAMAAVDKYFSEEWGRACTWELYKEIEGQPYRIEQDKQPGESFVLIDDFTDDFDFPEDFDRWMERWRAR